MAIISNLVIGITANAAGFAKELDGAQKKLAQFKSAAMDVGKLMGSKDGLDFAKNLADQFTGINPAVDAMAGGMKLFIGVLQDAVGQIKEMKTVADQLGTSVNTIFELQHTKGGDSIIAGLQLLQANLGDAVNGSESAQKKFEDMGISWQKWADMDPANLARAAAEQIKNAGSASQQAAVSMDLLGKAGRGAIGVMKEGEAGLDKGAERAHKFATRADIEGAEQLAKKWKNLGNIFEGLKLKIASGTNEMIRFYQLARDAQGGRVFAQNVREVGMKIPAPPGSFGADISGLAAAGGRGAADMANLVKEAQKLADQNRNKLGGMFGGMADSLRMMESPLLKMIEDMEGLGASIEQINAAGEAFNLDRQMKALSSQRFPGLAKGIEAGSSEGISAVNRMAAEKEFGDAQRDGMKALKEKLPEAVRILERMEKLLKAPPIAVADIN